MCLLFIIGLIFYYDDVLSTILKYVNAENDTKIMLEIVSVNVRQVDVK